VLVAVVVAVGAVSVLWSGARLERDPQALARVRLQPFAGKLQAASATDASGHPIALLRHGKLLTPAQLVEPGQTIAVDVVIRRPGWVGWALGKDRHERLTVRAPVAHVTNRWVSGASPRVRFDTPVAAVALGTRRRQAVSGDTVALPASAPAGSTDVAAAARSWEHTGAPERVSWFPAARNPVALASPAPGGKLAPSEPLRLTFSTPVAQALGGRTPVLEPKTKGDWRRVDSHTLSFQPTGTGVAMGISLRVTLPRSVEVADTAGHGLHAARAIEWKVPPPSTLRLHQLLAEAGYLPLDWSAAGADVPRTRVAQAKAAIDPPAGSFSWRYPNTPHELTRQWNPKQYSEITRGAVMMFQARHHLTVDALAGPAVWKALIADTIAQRRRSDGYSYVYVHRKVPQLLTLWHNGHTVLHSPGNTGVPAAPTALGTFPVFEHIAVGTMSGTNPDGSHYHDPGIKWISYFHGGEALHAFPRASFGTPQSLGCVELPEAAAKKVWPYTPIGTLVTIEN
jgi:hypothetical protein